MIDVAQTAGVSIATVSAFLNDTSNVSPDLTRRIDAAIRDIGYQRNAVARSLKIGATRTIGLTVADIRNPFFTDVVATIQQVLNRAGYAVMLCSNEEDTAKQDEQIKLLLDRMVDGLIIAPAGEDEIMKRLVTSTRKPVVLIDRVCDGLDIDAVVLDNRKGAFDATAYLIGLGHRRIGYLSGPSRHLDRPRSPGRLSRCAPDNGVAFLPELVREGQFPRGRRLSRGDAAAHHDRPTDRDVLGQQSDGDRRHARDPRHGPDLPGPTYRSPAWTIFPGPTSSARGSPPSPSRSTRSASRPHTSCSIG